MTDSEFFNKFSVGGNKSYTIDTGSKNITYQETPYALVIWIHETNNHLIIEFFSTGLRKKKL